MKKSLLLLMSAVVLSLFLASCGRNNEPEGTTDTNETTDSRTTPPPTNEDGNELEPITVTWFNTLHMITPFQETMVGEEIFRRTGIRLEIISGDMDLFMVLAAGGDLPDVVWLANDDGTIARTLMDTGAVIPLDDLLAERGQNVLRRNSEGMRLLREQHGSEQTFFIPTATSELNLDNPAMNPWTGIYTRHDLWVAMGAPEVNGEDEFLQMLRRMQDENPISPVGTRTFAISAWTDWGLWPYLFMYPQMYGYRGSQPFFFNIEDYSFQISFTDPDSIFWRGIEFYFKANQLGIFDPEGLVQNWAQYAAKVNNGEVFVGPASDWEPPDTSINPPEAGRLFHIPGAFPHIHGVWAADNPGGWGFSNARGISANAQHPERIMDLFNFLDSDEGARLLHSGVEGVHWDWIDGEPQPIGDWLAAQMGDAELWTRVVEEQGVSRLQFNNSGTWVADDGFPIAVGGVAIAREVAKNNPAMAAFAEFHGLPGAFPGEVYADWVHRGIARSPYHFYNIPDHMPPGPPEFGQIISLAEQFIIANLGDLILAADPAAFEAQKARVIDEINRMGFPEVVEDMHRSWAIAYDIVFGN